MDIIEIAVGTFAGFVTAQLALGQLVKYTLARKRSKQLGRLADFEQQLLSRQADLEKGVEHD